MLPKTLHSQKVLQFVMKRVPKVESAIRLSGKMDNGLKEATLPCGFTLVSSGFALK